MKIFEDSKIKIELPKLIASRALLCANSGGGKSYALRKILEEAGKNVMSIVLDYEGEFKTLREKFDFLLIGPAGDVPINISAAPLLPRKLMELSVSTIIDISDLKLHDRILYVKKFLDALIELPHKYWKPCLVIVDEAHNLCGQQEKQASAHAVIDLMTRGRKRGYCGILSTQRISKLHKDAVAEANYYLVGRTSLDIDMNRASEILGFASKADKKSLRTLTPGTFYFFDPQSDGIEKVKVAKTQTTHSKVGIDLKGKITPPTAKIKAMLSKLNDLPKEAQSQVRTLEELKKQNRELQRELKKLSTGRADPRQQHSGASEKQIEAAGKKGFAEAETQYKTRLKTIEKTSQLLMRKLNQIGQLAETEGIMIDSKPVVSRSNPFEIKQPSKDLITGVSAGIKQRTPNRPSQTTQRARIRPPAAIEGDKPLGRCARSILSLLYNNPQRGFKITLVGVFTGYSNKSGGFKNAISKLNAAGLIIRRGKEIIFNPQAQSETIELLGDDINLHETFTIENWAQKLPLCASVIYQFLMQNPNDEFSKEELAENTDYKVSGGFKNAISQLNSLSLLVRGNGTIRLNSEILEL